MSTRPRPLSLLLFGALTSSACQGGDGTTDGSTGAATDATAATAQPATDVTSTDPTEGPADPTTSTSSTTSTSGPTTSVGTTDASTTTSTDPSATDSETGASGLACPLGDEPGVQQLALAPALFSAGDDPSDSPACAIVNPERGFHGFTNLRNLDGGILTNHANSGFSVVYGQVLLPEFRDAPLDADVLAELAASFDLVREHGMKVVPRFHYSNGEGEPDAELERILGHIEQLTPLLQEHADVILTLQAGFVGLWGEWHGSMHGLDAPGPRKQILDALLAALPPERSVSVRRPSFKQQAYGGPLTADSAHDGSALARVGHVNDCFLASDDDFGTYQEPGEKDYAVADSAFVPVGGETCAVNPPRSECPSALAELALHHWTHLNTAYKVEVLQSWQQDGCYAEIACRLGYRIAVPALRWAGSGVPGGALPVALELVNDGFAAPVNPRPLVLVFDGPTRVDVPAADFDLRALQPGAPQTVCIDAALPADLPSGTYRIGLRLADPAPSLAGDPRQAIRLANDTGVEWNEGVNWFEASFAVD